MEFPTFLCIVYEHSVFCHQLISYISYPILTFLGAIKMSFLKYILDLEDASIWNIVSTTTEARSSVLFMQESGDFFAQQQYFTTRDGQGSFLIKLTLSGRGILKYNSQEYRLQPDDLFFIDCKNWQHYGTDPDYGSWRVLWVYFNGVTAETYYKLFLKYTSGRNVITLPRNSAVYGLMQTLLHFYDEDHIDHLEADIRCSGLLTRLLTECIALAATTQNVTLPVIVQNVRSYLVENFTRHVTLDELSAKFFLNPSYLQKLFKRYTNQSPTDYLIYLRIAKAKELIRTTQLPLNEIAFSVGIESYSYFIRLFKKREGMTPREYQAMWPVV